VGSQATFNFLSASRAGRPWRSSTTGKRHDYPPALRGTGPAKAVTSPGLVWPDEDSHSPWTDSLGPRQPAGTLGLKHIRTRPYTPPTNGKPCDSSRPSARNGLLRCLSRSATSATPLCLDTGRFIFALGSTQPSAVDPLSSGSASCFAELPGETQHLSRLTLFRSIARRHLKPF